MTSSLERLREEDRVLDGEVERLTLAPEGTKAACLEEIAERTGLFDLKPHVQQATAQGLCAWTRGQREHFPDNIFWDLDFPVAMIVRQVGALESDTAVERASQIFALLIELQQRYGRHSVIRFRYVHDFTYGLDWAKWVGREPNQTGDVGPFDWKFLQYLRTRAIELLSLIDRDDSKYPTLRDDKPRNPFGFRRDPPAERAILESMAKANKLPVQTWDMTSTPQWDRPYQEFRAEIARALGFGLSG